MKKIIQILTVLFAITTFGQKIADFRYVMIPGTFKDEKTNQYNLNILLANKLKQKQYTVLSENKESWPKDALDNPCSVLSAELENISSLLRNKIEAQFYDCNSKKIAVFEGKSFEKDFEPGMKDALQIALKTMAVSTPTEKNLIISEKPREVVVKKVEVIAQNIAINTEPVITKEQSTTEVKSTNNAEIYSNGTLTLNKINLANGEFILVNPNNSVPYATFKPSSKKDTFRVQLQEGSSTLGYLENGKILVEIPNADGSFKSEIFEKK